MAENVEKTKAKITITTCRATDLLKAIIENKDMTLNNNRTLLDENGRTVKIRMQTCLEAQKICAMLTSSDPSKKNTHLTKRIAEITEALGNVGSSIRGRKAPNNGETKQFSVNKKLGSIVIPVKLLYPFGTTDFQGKVNVLFDKHSILITIAKPLA